MNKKLTTIMLAVLLLLIGKSQAATLTQVLGDNYIYVEVDSGQQITLNFNNNANYTFTKWTVESGDVTIDTTNPMITFTMPSSDVVIRGNYAEESAGEQQGTLLSDVATVGSYVTYVPSSTSYIVPTTISGYTSDQTYNPSSITSWRIFSKDGENIEIISTDSVGSLLLSGSTGYANIVQTLQDMSAAYVNPEYAVSGRSLGYYDEKIVSSTGTLGDDMTEAQKVKYKIMSYSLNYGDSGFPYTDHQYRPDFDMLANHGSMYHSSEVVLLASRRAYNLSDYTYYRVNSMDATGSSNYVELYAEQSNGLTHTATGRGGGVRPIVSLKSGLTVTGTGTADDPYIINESNPSQYTVTYCGNGGTGEMMPQSVAQGSSLTLTTNVYEHYILGFIGWSTSATATTPTYTDGQTITPTSDITLYPVWKTVYNLTYDANGGSDAPATQRGINLTISDTIPTRSGYVFRGWSESSSATYATYTAGGSITLTANTTLYAVWKEGYLCACDDCNGIASEEGGLCNNCWGECDSCGECSCQVSICTECGGCSECDSISESCYECGICSSCADNFCTECGICSSCSYDDCDNCGSCYCEYNICTECYSACDNCSDICPDCYYCRDCCGCDKECENCNGLYSWYELCDRCECCDDCCSCECPECGEAYFYLTSHCPECYCCDDCCICKIPILSKDWGQKIEYPDRIEYLEIVDSAEDSRYYSELDEDLSYNVDINENGDIKLYYDIYDSDHNVTVGVLVGNGSGSIRAPADSSGLFGWFYHGIEIYGLELLDTSEVTDMNEMFWECLELTSLDLSNFNTTLVTDMTDMFKCCYNLEEITIGTNFSFTGNGSTSCTLPTPSSTNITGADGNWYKADGTVLTPVQVATDTRTEPTTYYATKPLSATLNVGDYISYMPSITSHTVLADVSGADDDQTYNPSTYVGGWRVFNVNGNDVEIISADSVGALTLYGAEGYINAVQVLQDMSAAYVNSTYAESGRSLGYYDERMVSSGGILGEKMTEEQKASYKVLDTSLYPLDSSADKEFPYDDNSFWPDRKVIEKYGSLYDGSEYVWVASRHSTIWCYDYRCFHIWRMDYSDGSISTGNYDCFATVKSSYGGRLFSYGVRPIIKLKSTISISGGSGTSTDPYTITIE